MSEDNPESIPDPVKQLISRLSAGANSILFVSQENDEAKNNQINFDQTHVITLTLSQLNEDLISRLGLFDFVLIKDLFEKMDKQKVENIIAQMRDVHTRELLLIISESSFNQASDLISLGFTRVAEFDQDGQVHQAWYFALESYKRVPEWLNSQYWANPELFKKYRW